MTQVTVRGDLVGGVIAACALAGVRKPSSFDMATGTMVPATSLLEWLPDLSPNDLTTVQTIVKLAVGSTLITKAERDALEPQLATIRLFQQQSQSDFIALAQNARDRMLFDNVTAIIRILRVFLRD